jgi:hypothetical protein
MNNLSLYSETPGATSATSAISATSTSSVQTSVMIHGQTKHLGDPLTHNMVRAFRQWAMSEAREGRTICLSGHSEVDHWLCSEQPGICQEVPYGACSDADMARLKVLADSPPDWWMAWPIDFDKDCARETIGD